MEMDGAKTPRGRGAGLSATLRGGELRLVTRLRHHTIESSRRRDRSQMVISGATDGAMFLTYLKDVLAPQPWAGAVVVLDNLAAPSFIF